MTSPSEDPRNYRHRTERDAPRVRDAYAELGRLLLRRPARDPALRDFWKVWLPCFAAIMLAFAILDPDLLSLTTLAILAAGMVLTVAVRALFARGGIVWRRDGPG
ncbi:MAG TPA: hypothetical protein VF533_07670 [Solirubrobacteraceae bacterium]